MSMLNNKEGTRWRFADHGRFRSGPRAKLGGMDFRSEGGQHVKSSFCALAVLFGIVLGSGSSSAASPSLYEVVKACRDSYVLYHLPLLGSDGDYCTVPANSYVDGRDVSWRTAGRQLDVVEVIRGVRNTVKGSKSYRRLARQLDRCVQTYYDVGSIQFPDTCLFGSVGPNTWSTADVLRALVRIIDPEEFPASGRLDG